VGIPDPDVAIGVAGQVKHFEASSGSDADRLAPAQAEVDGSVAAHFGEHLPPLGLVGLVETVRLVPEVVLGQHRGV
jgi:hypothetical protein